MRNRIYSSDSSKNIIDISEVKLPLSVSHHTHEKSLRFKCYILPHDVHMNWCILYNQLLSTKIFCTTQYLTSTDRLFLTSILATLNTFLHGMAGRRCLQRIIVLLKHSRSFVKSMDKTASLDLKIANLKRNLEWEEIRIWGFKLYLRH